MGLNNINSKSTWGQAASDINTNFTTIDSDLKKVKNATTRNKGYFSSIDELKAAFSTANVGDIAYVGSAYPYAIWKWNGSAWANSGSTGGEESVNLGDYYTKVETDEKFTETDEKLSELGSKLGDFGVEVEPIVESGVYVDYTDGNVNQSVSQETRIYKFNNDGYSRIVASTMLTTTYFAAIAFYNSEAIDSSGYNKLMSVRSKASGFSLNEYIGDVPSDCKTIVISSSGGISPKICAYKPEANSASAVQLSTEFSNMDSKNVQDAINEMSKYSIGISAKLNTERYDTYLLDVNGTAIEISDNYSLYIFKNKGYNNVRCTLAHSNYKCSAIGFYKSREISGDSIISSLESIEGIKEYNTEVPKGCKYICLSNRKAVADEINIDVQVGYQVSKDINDDDDNIASSKSLNNVASAVFVKQPNDVTYFQGEEIVLEAKNILDGGIYEWEIFDVSTDSWRGFATCEKYIGKFTSIDTDGSYVRCKFTKGEIVRYSRNALLQVKNFIYRAITNNYHGLQQEVIDNFNKYIHTGVDIGEIVDIESYVSFESYACAVIDCSNTVSYTISGHGGNLGRLWAFLDKDNKLISCSGANAYANNKILLRPNEAVKFVVNFDVRKVYSLYKSYEIQDSSNNLKNSYIKTNLNIGEYVSLDRIYFKNYECAFLRCSEGDIFTLGGKAGNAGRLWAFLDNEQRLLSVAKPDEIHVCKQIVAPRNSSFIILNFDSSLSPYWKKGVAEMNDFSRNASIQNAVVHSVNKDLISKPSIIFDKKIGSDSLARAKASIFNEGNMYCVTYGENLDGTSVDVPTCSDSGTLAMMYKKFSLIDNIEEDVEYGLVAKKGSKYIDINGNEATFTGGCGLPSNTINGIQYFSSAYASDDTFVSNKQSPIVCCCPISIEYSAVNIGIIHECSLTIDGERGRFDLSRLEPSNNKYTYYTTNPPHFDGSLYHWCQPVKKGIAYMTSFDGINWTLNFVADVDFQPRCEVSCVKEASGNIMFCARTQSRNGYESDTAYIGIFNSYGALKCIYKIGNIAVRPILFETYKTGHYLLLINTNSKETIDFLQIVEKENNSELYFYRWFSIHKKCTWYTHLLAKELTNNFDRLIIAGGDGGGSENGITVAMLEFDEKPKFESEIDFCID